jgi:hypothetical protein
MAAPLIIVATDKERTMRHASYAVSALLVFSAACSNDEREPSLIPEAQAAPTQQKDYGWRTTPSYPSEQAAVRDYE